MPIGRLLEEHPKIGVLNGAIPFPLLLGLVVQHHVGLVVDLLLDDLLDDVLQGEQADGLVVGVALPLVVDLLHQGHVTLLARLELVKHVCNRQKSLLSFLP